MPHRRLVCIAVLGLLACLTTSRARAAVPPPKPTMLYDAARGTLPQAQGWAYLYAKGSPSQSLNAGAALLDTTSNQSISAGYFASKAGFAGSTAPVPALDRTAGFTLTFTLQVLEEAHSSNNRAGFSVIVLGSDARGIELGFWNNRIWAQEGGTAKLFTQAEGAPFNTTAALARYDLVFKGNSYQLRSGGVALLSGPVRDYRAFSGYPDPYKTPDFLFFGDDTSSAAARFRLGQVSVALPGSQPPPTAGSNALFVPVAHS